MLTGDQDTQTVKEPSCRLECKTLSTKDYTDLLWTTVAEFPGMLRLRSHAFTSSWLPKAFCILTVHPCVCVCDQVLKVCEHDTYEKLGKLRCARLDFEVRGSKGKVTSRPIMVKKRHFGNFEDRKFKHHGHRQSFR